MPIHLTSFICRSLLCVSVTANVGLVEAIATVLVTPLARLVTIIAAHYTGDLTTLIVVVSEVKGFFKLLNKIAALSKARCLRLAVATRSAGER